jgi:FdhE protein
VTVPELFAKRAERASALAKQGGAATPLLLFASSLLSAQQRLAAGLAGEHERTPLSGSLGSDVTRFAPLLRCFLEELRDSPAPEIATEAERRRHDDEPTARARLITAWEGDAAEEEDPVSRAFLRPYLETLRAAAVAPERRLAQACSFCGGPPSVGFLRSEGPSEGAGRHLVCARCGGEDAAGRIRCAACGEADPKRLPVFRSEKFPAVRIEACETCRSYVKAIDLSLDARPIPEVDELLSASMDLWAREEGWRRIAPGLAGI